MTTVSRIKAGQYSVSDGRFIIKQGSSWYIIQGNGDHDFGPVPTLAAAKSYVSTGSIPLGNHNRASQHSRRQSKKEFNAHLAAEAKNGNPAPLILWVLVLIGLTVLFTALGK
ncbi:hypothetical protein VME0621_03804 [Vibrio mediterranei]|uniref:hypothetical protein n=1 Tax=Vibrio mediterranei TaxID=689 RepID=UPI000783B39A|nr:hypothetical protein [Vibrio mediterranei]SBO11668.1 hypothetical protein VME0621_03804 [Vibrio mediterranei]